jgi:Ca2+-dependent lipid-binding protein
MRPAQAAARRGKPQQGAVVDAVAAVSRSPRVESPRPLDHSGTLAVTVIEAKNLQAVDSSGTSDPYIKIRVVDSQHGKGKNEKILLRTKVIKKTTTPVWNESATLEVESTLDPVSLNVHVKDHNTIGAAVDLGELDLDVWDWIKIPREAENGQIITVEKWCVLLTPQ